MENKSLYYTDPLAAAYMAREFGVKYKVSERLTVKRGVPARHVKIKRELEISNPWSIASNRYKNKKLVITPDSYHIFEPQEGDEGKDKDGKPCKYNDGYWWLFTGDFYEFEWREEIKITERNGKPFFWPEEEV